MSVRKFMEQIFTFKIIRAVIGLGNPGSKYHKNRHNIGFRVLDALAERLHGSWHTVNEMEVATIRVDDCEVHLIKPQTFMNDSGRVLGWLTKKGIKPDQILVVHDELEKDLGKLLFKFGGSHKGHNGLRSIMGVIGADFWRLKFGIGRPTEREDVPRYVLENFPPAQEAQVAELIYKAVEMIA